MADFIRVTFDVREWERVVGRLARKAAPAAMAQAVTWMAKDARAELRADLPSHFTVRTKWTAGSIRAEDATPQTLTAEVGSVADYMRLQALGGPRPSSDGPETAVPVRENKTDKASNRNLWPKRILKVPKRQGKRAAAPQAYKALIGGRREGVFRDINGTPTLLWVLGARVHLKPRWPLEQTVRELVKRKHEKTFHRAMRREIAKLKRRAD